MIEILNKLPSLEYAGDKYNQQQYEFIRNTTKYGKIFITGDLLNDYMLETKYKLWSIGQKDIQVPLHDRAIILYYKNEHPNLYTIKSDEFYVYYQILSLMIDRKLLKSFNTIKVICRHSVPSCYDNITCEKISKEIGPKNFEVFCNMYANTIFFSSATVNSDRFGSRSIITRNIYDIKKNIPDTHILFDYIFCPVDQTGQYTDGDEFIWQDGTRSTYRARYGSELQHQSAISLNKKVEDFIACILKLDSDPLFICS
jgi:hypothetical protein